MTDPASPSNGVPSEEELAAILVAVDMVWPQSVAAAPAQRGVGPWRFSGRWWGRPVPARRERPWINQIEA